MAVVRFIGACHMSMERVIRAEPSDILRFATPPRNNTVTLIQFLIPRPMIPPLLQSIEFTFQRRHRKNKPILGKCTIVNHSTEWRFIPCFLRLFPFLVDGIHNDIATCILACSAGFIAETNHLAGIGIEFWMGSESGSLDLAVKVPFTNRFEGGGIHGEGRTVFFRGEEHAAVENDVGVGSGTNDALDDRVVGEWVAVLAKQVATVLGFDHESIGFDILLLVIDMSIMKSER